MTHDPLGHIDFTTDDRPCAACGSTEAPRRFRVCFSQSFVSVWGWCPTDACSQRGPEAVYWQRITQRPRGLVDPTMDEVTP